MPHIILEHTENFEPGIIKLLFTQLRIILIKNAGIKEENCKCRAILIPIYAVERDDEDSKHFYHLEISLLKGRSYTIRQKICKQSLECLQEYFVNKNGENVKQFSVEIRGINPNNYFTSNTL